MEEITKSAYEYLSVMQEIASQVDPNLQIEVGIQPHNNANLNYKVYCSGTRLLPDFNIFEYPSKYSIESKEMARVEFEKYFMSIKLSSDS